MSVQTQRGLDCCLQCGKTRAEVRDYFNSPCATATYGETVEGLDDWPRHHWADWSDAELRKAGIPEDRWAENRRTDIYDFEWVQREAGCARDGHAPEDMGGSIVCMRCYSVLNPEMKPTSTSTSTGEPE